MATHIGWVVVIGRSQVKILCELLWCGHIAVLPNWLVKGVLVYNTMIVCTLKDLLGVYQKKDCLLVPCFCMSLIIIKKKLRLRSIPLLCRDFMHGWSSFSHLLHKVPCKITFLFDMQF